MSAGASATVCAVFVATVAAFASVAATATAVYQSDHHKERVQIPRTAAAAATFSAAIDTPTYYLLC